VRDHRPENRRRRHHEPDPQRRREHLGEGADVGDDTGAIGARERRPGRARTTIDVREAAATAMSIREPAKRLISAGSNGVATRVASEIGTDPLEGPPVREFNHSRQRRPLEEKAMKQSLSKIACTLGVLLATTLQAGEINPLKRDARQHGQLALVAAREMVRVELANGMQPVLPGQHRPATGSDGEHSNRLGTLLCGRVSISDQLCGRCPFRW
jgi:hypothetical protein